MKKLGIYIHIPFCVSKCRYCGFYSHGGATEEEHIAYVKKLLADIRKYAGQYRDAYTVDTIFIGGGTPTVLQAEAIESILAEARSGFTVEENAEVTVEANPGTLSGDVLACLRRSGVNRLSMGVQSFDDRVLCTLGRIHTASQAHESFLQTRAEGFDNINLDLMFSVPGQSPESWHETLEDAIDLAPDHISFYSLQIEEGTPFYDMFVRGEIAENPDDIDRAMYYDAVKTLGQAGYNRYEISNCALPGRECRHNLKYWNLDDYLGIGTAAHSYMGGVRFAELPDGTEFCHENRDFDNMSEFVFTGLRKTSGISLTEFSERFGKDIWDVFDKNDRELTGFFQSDYLREENNMLYLTDKGIDVSNKIMSLFV